MNGINPIAASLYNLAAVKRRKQLEQQFDLVNPILAGPGDAQAKVAQALAAIRQGRQRPKGIGGVLSGLNPFSAHQGGGSELEMFLLQESLREPKEQQTKDLSPSQLINQLKLNEATRILAIPENQRTEDDRDRLNSVIYGWQPQKPEKTKETPLIELMKFTANVHKAVKAGEITPETGRAMITSVMNKPYNVLDFPQQTATAPVEVPEGFEMEGFNIGEKGGVSKRFKRKPPSQEDITGLTNGMELEGVSAGPSGVTKRFAKVKKYPPEYESDLANAISAIDRGADANKVFQRISVKYPNYSAELKRILLSSTVDEQMELLSEVMQKAARGQ